jgi:hypothetical protein
MELAREPEAATRAARRRHRRIERARQTGQTNGMSDCKALAREIAASVIRERNPVWVPLLDRPRTDCLPFKFAQPVILIGGDDA